MKTIITILLSTSLVFANADLDEKLSFKSIVALVLNGSEEPVHSDQVEAEMIHELKDRVRFDFSEPGYLAMKESLKQVKLGRIDSLQNTQLDALKPALAVVSALGVKGAFLSYVRHSSEGYQLYFYLVSLPSGEIIHRAEKAIDNPENLENFSKNTRRGIAELLKGIPFDATVMSRDGYRVILDRGSDLFRPNQQISAYTIENKDGNLVFEETGVIQITQVEPNLAFGKVTVEKRPKEIFTGNKIRLETTASTVVSNIQFLEESSARGPASLPAPMMAPDSSGSSTMQTEADFNPQFEISKGKVGNIGMDLGALLINFGTTAVFTDASGNPAGRPFSSNRVFPQATVRGEVFLTSRMFFEGAYSYSLGSVEAYSGNAWDVGDSRQDRYLGTSANITAFKLQLGYRLNIFAPNPGPILYFKAGYSRQAFSFDSEMIRTPSSPYTTPTQSQFVDTSYGGILVTGGFKFHPMEKTDMAFEVGTNIFPKVNEDLIQSGPTVSNISSWELSGKLGYELTKEVDFTAKAFLQNFGAEFAGVGNRDLSVSSVSQSIKGVQAGLSYFF